MRREGALPSSAIADYTADCAGRLGSSAAAIAAGWLPASDGYLLSAALATAALLTTVTASRTRKSPAHPAER